jgi:two-component system sensor histidine kinase KdpD
MLGQAALAWERIHLEAEARAVGELRSRDQLRSTLLASIGHDLRTPLTAVSAAVDALRREGGQSRNLDLLHRETRRLSRFFADLIDMTRVDANALAPRLEPVDLTDSAANALADMAGELGQHLVTVEVPSDLPLVETDPRLLGHMLINLLSNAATWTPPGSSIRLWAEGGAGGLTLGVDDDGPGLPAGREAALFERFQTGDVSDRTGGSGMGLAIVKGFADALGMTVEASNRAEGGASFRLRFPPELVRPMPEAAAS